jgi:hypothetical protein
MRNRCLYGTWGLARQLDAAPKKLEKLVLTRPCSYGSIIKCHKGTDAGFGAVCRG